jgi:hypothetical protein
MGKNMAVAKLVTAVESMNVDWLEIEDEDGVKYRYAKRGNAPSGAVPHVRCEAIPRQAQLVRDDNESVVLRQDADGLPAKIIVSHIELTVTPGLPFLGGWVGLLEYDQEEAPTTK